MHKILQMKKYFISLSVLSFVIVSGQHKHGRHCGFHHKQKEIEQKIPAIKETREKVEQQILQKKLSGKKDAKYSNIAAMNYAGQVYEIPVVVHVIESNAEKNARLKLTDEQIKTWLENANKMYAGTYGGDYYSTGDGIGQSAVIPFKLVLAQRDENCNPTTGIIRYNGSTLAGYDDNGVYSDTAGVSEEDIVKFAPHWSESGYYNIYIVTTFDGDNTTYGLMGYAYYPETTDSYYHTFMKASVVTNEDDSTLAHEFGHSLGLDHPFGDADSDGGVCPPVSSGLTDSEACLKDNDKVCDTEPIQSLLSVFPTPSNQQINPCTNENYKDTQYNVMNYTYSTKKFTAGQRDRAVEMFMASRKNLTLSLGGKAPEGGDTVALAAASCQVSATNLGRYGIGPKAVKLGNIDNQSSTYSSDAYYTDFSLQTCISGNIKTDLKENETHTLTINLGTTNSQRVKAWIDFNNDGAFTNDEMIADSKSSIKAEEFTKAFTIPSTAVKDTYLRMRVGADLSDFTACSVRYGQIEDYAVRITSDTLQVVDKEKGKDVIVAYNKVENKLVLSNTENIGGYQIYDMSGRLIQSGNSATNEIDLRGVSVGTYILKYKSKTEKFIKY